MFYWKFICFLIRHSYVELLLMELKILFNAMLCEIW
jgi:hypothetical protein